MSSCPFCSKETEPQAWNCPHCGEYLEGRRVLWLEYLGAYQAAGRDEKKLLKQQLAVSQQSFLDKLLAGKHDNWSGGKPKRFTVRAGVIRAFAGLSIVASLLAILGASLSIYTQLEPFFARDYRERSAGFDVPLPPRAQRLESPRAPTVSSFRFREDYAAPGSADTLFDYFDRQLPAEGWSRFGERGDGHQVYRKGRQWLGVIVPPKGGGFALTAPYR